MYYLKSRYYDPETCRFINADDSGTLGADNTILSHNLFAYCGNNPVNRKDDEGEFWHIVVGAVVGGVIGAALEIGVQLATGTSLDSIDWGAVGIEALSGAATGALLTSGLPAQTVGTGKAIVNTLTSIAHSVRNGDSAGETITKAAFTGLTTYVLANRKEIAHMLLDGDHFSHNQLETFVLDNSYLPRHMGDSSIAVCLQDVVINRFARAISRLFSYAIK